ncbi:MAG TPA: hypothetical protein VKA46_35295 [Gemmataceae bacterium]|nr:hypothetical protein [Gemmataceae bacterium]
MMLTLEQDHLSRLREQAGRGLAPSQMLRDLLSRINPEEPRSPVLAWYLMHAFGLEQHQVAAVFGWDPNGTGPLDDARLDELLARHIPAKVGG